jgi:hypothetical protein
MTNPKRTSQHQPLGRWIRVDLRLAIYLRDNFFCLICKRDLTVVDAEEITLDHIITKAQGGGNGPDNVYTCCKACNCSRQNQSLEQFCNTDALVRIQAATNSDIEPYRQKAKKLLHGRRYSAVIKAITRK